MKTSSAPPARVMRWLSRLNVAVYRLTGGRVMAKLNGAAICLVTMTGAKSGKRMTVPLMHTAHGDDVLLVASMGGAPKNPAWYYNLRASPQIEIQIGRRRRAMHASVATAAQRAELWPVAVRNFPQFDEYQRGTSREIPLFVCSPV